MVAERHGNGGVLGLRFIVLGGGLECRTPLWLGGYHIDRATNRKAQMREDGALFV